MAERLGALVALCGPFTQRYRSGMVDTPSTPKRPNILLVVSDLSLIHI